MQLRAFSVYDSKTEVYGPPMFFLTRGQAVRSFSDAANDEKAEFSRHAADYTLFEIGSFDQAAGSLLPITPVAVGNALTFRVKE